MAAPTYDRGVPVGALEAILDKVNATSLQALGRALYDEANAVMTVAKEVTTPIEDGDLAASGVVGDPEITDTSVTVTMGFGGRARAYSIFVHEDPDARHGAAINKPAGQTWKFLEKPALANLPGLAERVRDRVAAELNSALG